MKATAVPSPTWSPRKWSGVVLGLFALHAGLLMWFGARGPIQPRPAAPAPQLRWAGAAVDELLVFSDRILLAQRELLALTDPTLFAQSHAHGFSGAAWMRIPVPEYRAPAWSEPPRWLALDAPQLGANFRRYVQTNQPFLHAFAVQPEAQLAAPEIGATAPATAAPSALRVEGALASRRLLAQPKLPPWPHTDLLTNTVVQVLVNAEGKVVSPVLLGSSGLKAADEVALAVARAAQFNTLTAGAAPQPSATAAPLMFGTLVFEWQTLPLPASNAPPANP